MFAKRSLKLLYQICGHLGLLPFTTPHLEFAVKRTHGINKEEKQDSILGMIQVADAPGNRDEGQVNQVRIERRATNFTDNADTEETCHKPLPRQKRNQEETVQHNRKRMMEEVVETRIQLRTHQKEASVNSGKHYELRNAASEISFQKIKMAFFEEPE